MDEVISVRGSRREVGLVSIDDALRQRGAWFVLLRARNRIWYEKKLEFGVRWAACVALTTLCSQVFSDAGKEKGGKS